MKLLRSITITQRLILIFLILITGFITLTIAYQKLLYAEQEQTILIKRASDFERLVEKIQHILDIISHEANRFDTQKEIRYAEDFFDDDSFYLLKDDIDNLRLIVTEPEILALVNQLETCWFNYGAAFDMQINAQILVGLDNEHGILGNLHTAINAVEHVINNLNHVTLQTALLKIHRYERDFMINKDFEYINLLHDQISIFNVLLDQAKLSEYEKNNITYNLTVYKNTLQELITATYRLNAKIEDTETEHLIFTNLINMLDEQRISILRNGLSKVELAEKQATLFMTITLLIVGGLIALTLILLSVKLHYSLGRLKETVQRVSKGDLNARTKLMSKDELGILGTALDNLLNERMTVLARAERENELLNQSIISIIESVARMSQKDLTVKAIVAEDITGTISDALNLMASETSDVLIQIRSVSQAVEQAAHAVFEQAETVNKVATQERLLVQQSAEGLHSAGQALGQLAQGAQDANNKADTAMARTRQALAAVTTSVQGIDRIRDIIRETEKRIKRLGERSQEITGVVNLINAIAERTNILALNASMHAASAGEAGRGFAVVADEVQRLAESSQKATLDIAAMVNAIREETSDTLETMNRLIAQVAEGTRQAQEAGSRMRETETTTADLVKSVREMAEGAGLQAQSALELRKQSQVIVRSTEQTSVALKEQSTYTLRLVEYANTLREAISVFKLTNSMDNEI